MKVSEKIIEDILHGDGSKALKFLYDHTLSSVRRFIIHRGGTKDDADDIFQDAMIVFFQLVRNHKYETKKEIEPFVMAVCKNLYIDKLRKANKMSVMSFKDDYENIPELDNQLTRIVELEKAEMMHALFQQLDQKCQQILTFCLVEKKSMKEICTLLGYSSENVAKTIHYRCKQYFIRILESNKQATNLLRS